MHGDRDGLGPEPPLRSRRELQDRGGGGRGRHLAAAECRLQAVLSDDGEFLSLKTYDIVGRQLPLYVESLGLQPERQVVRVEEAFESARTDVERVEARTLTTSAEAVEAILANRTLVARTHYSGGRYGVELEYPVKTVNANERDVLFQPDTGPVLVPGPEVEPET